MLKFIFTRRRHRKPKILVFDEYGFHKVTTEDKPESKAESTAEPIKEAFGFRHGDLVRVTEGFLPPECPKDTVCRVVGKGVLHVEDVALVTIKIPTGGHGGKLTKYKFEPFVGNNYYHVSPEDLTLVKRAGEPEMPLESAEEKPVKPEVKLVKRMPEVGEYVLNLITGEICEVIALYVGKGRCVYVRCKNNKCYDAKFSDRPIEQPFDFLAMCEFAVLEVCMPEGQK